MAPAAENAAAAASLRRAVPIGVAAECGQAQTPRRIKGVAQPLRNIV